ncbi:MAG: heavy metal translocating P-type ATPase [Lachnospiraceae bacterium]|nr:heavy metal translocating P-type ATPase [Lachnospiraceae bacterium]
MTTKQKNLLIRIIIAAIFWIPVYLISEEIINVRLPNILLFILFLVPYLLVGHDIIRKAIYGIKNRQVFDENFLMTIATLGAIILGEYGEGVAVMLLYQVGELFQSYAVGKSRRSISELMDIRPDYANIEEDGELKRVDPDEVETGSIIIVNPGEKIPIDGIVKEGSASLNTSALTGESRPRNVSPGDPVVSGCISLNGVIKIQTTAEFDESTASKILDLVENAASQKSESENFISKFAKYYTPVVCYAALALVLIPPLFVLLTGIGRESYGSVSALWSRWIFRACTFLVISCPCAVVISIPLSFFAGIGGASSAGVLIKGSNYLEILSKVHTVALDKTGTITKGNFVVTEVHQNSISQEQLQKYAAMAECYSSHPISLSLQTAYGKKIDHTRVTDVEEISGEGILAKVDGVMVAVGNEKLMKRAEISFSPCNRTHHGTVIHAAISGEYAGHLVIADEIKETSREAVQEMKKAGVDRIVMLTGDDAHIAKEVAESVGIEDYKADLLPQDKVKLVDDLLKSCKTGEKLAFVGDGINDAPVIAKADVGIAMGALGSDAAIEAADIVLMDDDPLKIAKAIKISRKCLKIVKQNIIGTLLVKVICLVLAAFGIANMWIAILSDVGIMILAVLNAIRCLFVKKL